MVVEILGRWQNTRAHARSGHRYLFGNGEEAEKETITGLSVG